MRVGSEDADRDTGWFGGGQNALERLTEDRGRGVARDAKIVREVPRAGEEDVDPLD